MKNRLKEIFLKQPGQWWFWIMLALVVKGGILLFQLGHADHGVYKGLIGSVGGDTELYIYPVDRLIDSGTYDPDYRMPGYGLFYYLLRFCFSKVMAFNVLIILQYIAAALSVYGLALTSRGIFRSSAMFYVTYYLFLISTYSNLEDGSLLTESFTTSFLIFTVYFIVKWSEGYKNRDLIIAGLLATEVIFLRPVFALLLLLFVLFITVKTWRDSKPAFLKYALIFLIPFMLIDGAWTARNYYVHRHFLPLATVMYLRGGESNALFWGALGFMQAWGGNYVSWDPASEMRYFNIKEKMSTGHKQVMQDKYKAMPDDIYTSWFNADSLAMLRNMIADIQSDTDKVRITLHIKEVVAKFDHYGESIKKEKPFVYYIKAPVRVLRVFLLHSGTYNLFPKAASDLNKFELLIKIGYSLFYVLTLLFGFLGILLLLKRSLYLEPVMLFTGTVLYITFIHTVVLRLCEARYFMPAWPFLLVCAAYCLHLLPGRLTPKTR